MKGYSEEELEDFLSKVENINKKVSQVHLLRNNSIGERYRRR